MQKKKDNAVGTAYNTACGPSFLCVFKESEFLSEQYSAISFYSAIRILACTVCLAVFS